MTATKQPGEVRLIVRVVRTDKRDGRFYPPMVKHVLQQAWQDVETGEIQWRDVPLVRDAE